MPGMQGTTSVKKVQDVQDDFAITFRSKKQRELCRGVRSDLGNGSALEMPTRRIDRIPADSLRGRISSGEFLRSTAKSRAKPEKPLSHVQTGYPHRPTLVPESLDAQIRKFMERPDLRNCSLPGMISRISRQACEGWQRQARYRASKLSVKIKLDPCKKCQFYIDTATEPVRHKHTRPRQLNSDTRKLTRTTGN